MKKKFEIGKYYDHNPNHFRFARTYDFGSSYANVYRNYEPGWIEVILGCALIVLLYVGIFYCVDFF